MARCTTRKKGDISKRGRQRAWRVEGRGKQQCWHGLRGTFSNNIKTWHLPHQRRNPAGLTGHWYLWDDHNYSNQLAMILTLWLIRVEDKDGFGKKVKEENGTGNWLGGNRLWLNDGEKGEGNERGKKWWSVLSQQRCSSAKSYSGQRMFWNKQMYVCLVIQSSVLGFRTLCYCKSNWIIKNHCSECFLDLIVAQLTLCYVNLYYICKNLSPKLTGTCIYN